jgi:hypothetical protein
MLYFPGYFFSQEHLGLVVTFGLEIVFDSLMA